MDFAQHQRIRSLQVLAAGTPPKNPRRESAFCLHEANNEHGHEGGCQVSTKRLRGILPPEADTSYLVCPELIHIEGLLRSLVYRSL